MFPRLYFFALVAFRYLTLVSGGRLGQLFSKEEVKQATGDATSEGGTNAKSERSIAFRFLNNDTDKYKVNSLPDVPFDVGEMYAGMIPIDMNDKTRALYFVFQPTIDIPVDDITIWLNGGPGCSSLEGFFQDNGRFIWGWGQYAPTINQYSWVNLTNVLWVEQPVGTGFLIGEVRATSQEDVAADFLGFFANFQKIFGIKNFKIYVTGESYAGRYVPYIASATLNKNDTEHFKVFGALMYDPCIGSCTYTQQQAAIVPFGSRHILWVPRLPGRYFAYAPTGIQPEKRFDYSWDYDCDLWDFAYKAAYAPNPFFNVYQIGSGCPLQSDSLGYPTDLQYSYSGLPVYFDRIDVKRAIHAPENVLWRLCKGPVFLPRDGGEGTGDSSLDPIQSVLPRVIEKINRVLVSSGDLDMKVSTDGTLMAIQNMRRHLPSKPIVINLPDLQYQALFEANGLGGVENPQGVMGVQHFERGLMWAETYLCGHIQPQFQPRSSYRHLQWVLGLIDEL
ncbi:carboxypeptidase S3, penicillopeptidase S3, CPD-S3 [Leptodontidium sp. 2 PMI_412]|nr:carboxypeptidase S3, penicillopeptidase S3, CPD-S3 [Leptodontidium sp. 2 PMI_412]